MNKTTQSSKEGGAVEFAAGGFRYIPAVFQYSAGVTASAGFRIRRVRFQTPLPIPAGFAAVAGIIQAAGRPLTAFCACELRSPAPFSDDGFRKFNQSYVVTLGDWALWKMIATPWRAAMSARKSIRRLGRRFTRSALP